MQSEKNLDKTDAKQNSSMFHTAKRMTHGQGCGREGDGAREVSLYDWLNEYDHTVYEI